MRVLNDLVEDLIMTKRSSTPLDQLRDRIVAYITKDPRAPGGSWYTNFYEALGNYDQYELWAPGKRIQGVYLGEAEVTHVQALKTVRTRVRNVVAIIATDGTIQTFPCYHELVRQLKPVPVGTLVSIEVQPTR